MTATYQNRGCRAEYMISDGLLQVIIVLTLAVVVAPFLGLL